MQGRKDKLREAVLFTGYQEKKNTSEPDSFKVKFPSSRDIPEGSAAFLRCQKSACILNAESDFGMHFLNDEYRCTGGKRLFSLC